MGAWGTGPFDNDDAMDFVVRLSDDGMDAVRDALARVLDTAPEYLERDLGASALAAAEVIAAVRGQPSVNPPPEVGSWVNANRGASVSPGLVQDALRAVSYAADEQVSEVAQLWADTPDADVWRAAVADLRARLGG